MPRVFIKSAASTVDARLSSKGSFLLTFTIFMPVNQIIAFWHIKSWSLLATMLQTDPGCQPGPRPRVGILEFCAPPQIFKNIFKELESDFSDAIKLM